MWVSLGNDVFVNCEQLTNERDCPTEVKFGAEIDCIVESKNPKLCETFWRESKAIDWMLRKVAFWTLASEGKLALSCWGSWPELAKMVRGPLISFSSGCEIVLR